MLPEALRFQVGLVDQISKPLGNIQRQLNDVTNTYRQGTHTMMAGAAGMVGAGFALQQALMPAIEMDRVLGEVKSLGVADEQLQQLSDTALQFSTEYGKSATEFVAASYDIQSAIAGLSGNELSEFTRASGVLAAATKADTGTITNYVGTMYGIFQNSANEMGKADWVNMLGGQTAKAVQMFKTTGDQMSAAFTSVGASATSVGVGMTEQMAILGTLQATMSGSEAGTKYRAFLAGTAKAQDALNMQFTNAQGQMLPIVDILNQIKGRYGDTISVAEAAELSKAFGTQEAVSMIQLLMQNTDGLAGSIEDLGKVKGLDMAEQMAGAMTDQWERMEQGVFAISAAFGAVLLPAILPVVGSLADGATQIVEWTRMFPNITKYVGFAAIAILGAAAAGGAFTLMMGIGQQAMATYMLVMKAATGINALFTKGMAAMRVAMLAANIAIAANPIILVVGAVVAAIAAVGALIYYWDDLKASFGDTTWFQVLEGAITLITAPFQAAFQVLKGGWQWVMSGFTDTSGFDGLFAIADRLRNIFSTVFGWLTEQFSGVIDTAKSVMDWIPGFGDDDDSTAVKSKSVQQAKPVAYVPPGGAAKNIASYQTSSTNYGGVSIYPAYMSSPQDMASELEMAAG
ncbi:TPA: phage tail tape measure protein [Vibrio parahaemolyticus]|uniref:phage tail tape measure protein n=1 Tax=Vibrio parahaemolyticus TaxID=670 RepID=UPI0002A571A4|nr:phage tail tape measure protein [Vibrio parahaemolyticus]AGB11032.1 Phage-related tail protein [Vibrio parahaemolyticus BB22OP]MBE4138079.1 phage tail tape measure protein [Vibrio parahaemolyticus]MQF42719.1 phage tail tape measure protein [Vibrio parahaemolyticus]TOZ80037.1 phage tail tape measure protein [Vibrio parahaemolyticus]TOZ99757.1 phage tail tape measure protein [Vibrio parahaemolyticus]